MIFMDVRIGGFHGLLQNRLDRRARLFSMFMIF
jgi:hypothetical protein